MKRIFVDIFAEAIGALGDDGCTDNQIREGVRDGLVETAKKADAHYDLISIISRWGREDDDDQTFGNLVTYNEAVDDALHCNSDIDEPDDEDCMGNCR